jgi:hypothetical protein
VFGTRTLRRTFSPRRDELMGGRRNLQNEKLRDLYSSPNIIRIIKLSMRWGKTNLYMLLVGKLEGKMTLGRARHRWMDNIRLDLGEVE